MAGHGVEPSESADAESLEQQLELVVASDRGGAGENSCLFLVGQSGRGRLFPLSSGEVIIGRAPETDICLDEPAVSKAHTRLLRRGGDWWIEDLGSTNGTFVNGSRVIGSMPLTPGSSIMIGEARMLYLAGGLSREQTVFLAPNMTTDRLSRGTIPTTTASQRITTAPAVEEDPLALMFRILRLAKRYILHYAWLATVLICLGAAAGVAHSRLRPPAGTAWFEISLKEEASENPVDQQGGGRQRAFFGSAESVFLSLPLIRKTLAKLGQDSDDAAAIAVQKYLAFEPEGQTMATWRGEYSAPTSREAVELLQTHLDNFLETEIEKALQVFRTQTEFLSARLSEAAEGMRKAEGEFVAFRERHPDVQPGAERTAATTSGPTGYRVGRVQTTDSRLSLARQRLASYDPLAGRRLEEIGAREKAVTAAKAELEAARQRGLGDRHPDIRKLTTQLEHAQAQLASAREAKTTKEQKQASPEYQRLREEVQKLESEAKAVEEIAAAAKRASPPSTKKEPRDSLPKLEADYLMAEAALAAAQQHHTTLSQRLRASELQLELERANAEAHYDVITPPTAEVVSLVATSVKRGLLGAAIGFALTLLIAGALELHRLSKMYA